MGTKYKILIPIVLVILLAAGCGITNNAGTSGQSNQPSAPASNGTGY